VRGIEPARADPLLRRPLSVEQPTYRRQREVAFRDESLDGRCLDARVGRGLFVARDEDDRSRGGARGHEPRDIHAIHSGKEQVEQHEIGLECAEQFEGFLTRRRLSGDRETLDAEQSCGGLAKGGVVVHEEHAFGPHPLNVVSLLPGEIVDNT